MKSLVITLLASCLTLMAGVFLGAKYIGKGEVIATLCVMGEVAEKDGFLTNEQYRSLAEGTARKINSDYPLLAKNIALSDAAIENASPQSNCSQILVSFTKGIQ